MNLCKIIINIFAWQMMKFCADSPWGNQRKEVKGQKWLKDCLPVKPELRNKKARLWYVFLNPSLPPFSLAQELCTRVHWVSGKKHFSFATSIIYFFNIFEFDCIFIFGGLSLPMTKVHSSYGSLVMWTVDLLKSPFNFRVNLRSPRKWLTPNDIDLN